MFPPQLTVQSVDEEVTDDDVDAELSDSRSSFVSLLTLAASVTLAPFSAVTLKAMLKTAVLPAGSEAMVRLTVPVLLPVSGSVAVNGAPEVWASEAKVVPSGTGLVKTTFTAASGPGLVSSRR